MLGFNPISSGAVVSKRKLVCFLRWMYLSTRLLLSLLSGLISPPNEHLFACCAPHSVSPVSGDARLIRKPLKIRAPQLKLILWASLVHDEPKKKTLLFAHCSESEAINCKFVWTPFTMPLLEQSLHSVDDSVFISGESNARRGCGAHMKRSGENRTAYSSRLPSTRMKCKAKYARSRSPAIASTRRSRP